MTIDLYPAELLTILLKSITNTDSNIAAAAAYGKQENSSVCLVEPFSKSDTPPATSCTAFRTLSFGQLSTLYPIAECHHFKVTADSIWDYY